MIVNYWFDHSIFSDFLIFIYLTLSIIYSFMPSSDFCHDSHFSTYCEEMQKCVEHSYTSQRIYRATEAVTPVQVLKFDCGTNTFKKIYTKSFNTFLNCYSLLYSHLLCFSPNKCAQIWLLQVIPQMYVFSETYPDQPIYNLLLQWATRPCLNCLPCFPMQFIP